MTRQMEIAKLNRAQAIADAQTKPKLGISFDQKAIAHQQLYSFQNSKIAKISPPAEEEKCDLELTLATGSSSTRSQKGKQVKSSNSDSGTAVSSTSTESELAELKEFDVATAVRFQSQSKKRLVIVDEVNLQPPWLNQCLSLRMA
ncbi:hypothetical protein GUJ93_ZPchr0011g28822 [Zizania palustris]|uniref:Uncharacterized protein n=1 Tax=Zizania palustris TaxID=103762 RepID=A0A8J5WIZ5_ZIZPA|nr:hypothetical protein GUJ93_ZPchr0011g28822 [Zizania palustris]